MSKDTWVKPADIRPGDLPIMDFDGKGIDHIGLCIAVNPGDEIVTVEGNTGKGKDAKGGSVMVRTRPMSVIVGACRPAYAEGEAEKIIVTALREVKTVENPANSNKVKYTAAYGLIGAWCVMFVWWVFREAGLSRLFYGGGKTSRCTVLAKYCGYGADKLMLGSTGQKVKELQIRLNAMGHSCGAVDGDFGQKTLAAVKAFQTENTLTVDGIAGTETLELINTLLNVTEPITVKKYGMPTIISRNSLPFALPKSAVKYWAYTVSGGFSMRQEVGGGVPLSIMVAGGKVLHDKACHADAGYPEAVLYRLTDGTVGTMLVKSASELPPNVSWAQGGVGMLDFYDPKGQGFRLINSVDFSDVLRDTNHILIGCRNGLMHHVFCMSMTGEQVNALAAQLRFEYAVMLDGGQYAAMNGGSADFVINEDHVQYCMVQAI